MQISTKTKSGNIHIRISSDVKKVIEKAIAASGQSMTDFATRSLLNSANELLEREYTATLTDRDRDRLLRLLDEDIEPKAGLREAAAKHKELILEQMYKIELLTGDHDTDSFDCGDDKKNDFLNRFALQNTKGGLGRTYVAVKPPDGTGICGYYTISSSSVKFENPPSSHLPRYPLPAVLIGKLATDIHAQNQGLGTALLFDALKRAARVAEEIGIFLVEIRAVNDKAKNIYIRRGFTPMEDEPMKLFMNLKTVRKLLAE